MPRFGAHLSIAGGLHKAVERAVKLGCETVQIFTHSPHTWPLTPVRRGKKPSTSTEWEAKPLSDDAVSTFQAAVRSAKLAPLVAHDSYLINLAAPGEDLFHKSVCAFTAEIEWAERLGLNYLVTHPGSHVGGGETRGIRRVISGLDEALRRCAGYQVRVLIETTAGQGTSLGWRFEQIAQILDGVAEPERFGVCFDTCHVFAAGYPLDSTTDYEHTMQQFDDSIGRERIALFHLNDSAKPLGSRVDRHAGIGQGEIGAVAFRRLVNDPRFASVPMILETPKTDELGRDMDPIHLRMLRQFTNQREAA
jgi:deoxyribonuclease-4